MSAAKLLLALNHLVILLPLASLIPLLAGMITKNRLAILCGLSLALLGSSATGLVMGTGEEAYERYKDGPVTAYLDHGARDALEQHENLAHRLSKVCYSQAAVSLLALIVGFAKHSWLSWSAAAVSVLCLASIVAGITIADSGGKIRRPDFRTDAATPINDEQR